MQVLDLLQALRQDSRDMLVQELRRRLTMQRNHFVICVSRKENCARQQNQYFFLREKVRWGIRHLQWLVRSRCVHRSLMRYRVQRRTNLAVFVFLRKQKGMEDSVRRCNKKVAE